MKKKQLSDIWLKAAVVGSLWATVEIILGSFFHNLRMPFAGTVLAMISVMLMVSFHRMWKVKGLFWRAGVICALMKSISPSAVLLGPMTGILTEALLMEFFVRLVGGNAAGYLVGGAIALMSTIAHKIVNLLIIYGFDFVNVLVNLYDYAVQQIGIENIQPETALGLLFGIYALLGIAAAITGMLTGKTQTYGGREKSISDDQAAGGTNEYFKLNPDQQFSLKLLFFHMFAVMLCLVVVGNYSLLWGSVFIAAYVIFSVLHYKRAMRHLKRPFFWVQVVLLTFLATMFYNGFQEGNVFNNEGLMAGLQMNVRAVLILVGFSALSVELRNPVIRAVLMKRGLAQLYLSLGLAFTALPWIVKNIPPPGSLLKHPGSSISWMLSRADDLLDWFSEKNRRPEVIIITGERHEGKTTFTKKLVDELTAMGKAVGGFLAPGTFENNRRAAFKLLSIETGEEKPLCSIHFSEGEQAGPFCFHPDGQRFGKALLEPSHITGLEFVIVDEVGPLELKGQGWAEAIDQMMTVPNTTLVLIVRRSLEEAVRERWSAHNAIVYDIGDRNPQDVARLLI